MSLLVVVGFSAEAALLPPGTAVLNAAANPEKLAAALGALRPSAVLSFGIAGGLDPALRPGALLVARAVVAEARWPAHAAWSAALAAATGAAMVDLAGAPQVIATPGEKAALYARSGAAAVDMESAVIARSGIPFAVLRAVADTADETLPPAAAEGLDEAGNPAPWRVMRALLRRPGDLPGVIRMGLRSQAALRALRAVTAQALRPPPG